MLSDELLARIQNNSDFAIYKDFVFDKINELNSVEGLDKMNNDKAGEEAKIRFHTVSKLLDILNPILNFSDKKDHSVEQVKKAKSKHGL